uniref:patched domain-containing protein 3-like isoform X1 n=1 Tax=Styela clava TaxID=7725 RepID=UPI0019396D87|nr:patched domain-containing protein 3-like isoform X1 [Styela clava]
MEPTFQTKQWRIAAASAYIGMIIGALVISSTIPLTLLAMGGINDLNILAVHCNSLKTIQYWFLGWGGLILVAEFMAVVASMKKHKIFRIVVTAMLLITIMFSLTLVIWGSVESDGRKIYFQSTWNDMDDGTKHFIESYFYCCGYESKIEYTTTLFPLDNACYAIPSENTTWPEGCYNRVISSYLTPITLTNSVGVTNTIGTGKVNPFLVAFIFTFMVIILTVGISTATFIAAMLNTSRPIKPPTPNDFVLENATAKTYGEPIQNGKDAISAGDNDVDVETIQISNTMSKNLSATEKARKESSAEPEAGLDTNEANSNSKDHITTKKIWYNRIPDTISEVIGDTFYWIGFRVGKHPKSTIIYSLILTVAMSVGLLQRYEDTSTNDIAFLVDDNPRLIEYNIFLRTFITEERGQSLIVEDETNVLSSENFITTLNLENSVKNLTSSTGQTFSDICLSISGNCKQRSLFEFWEFDNAMIEGLSNSDILAKINENPLTSPVFGDNVDVTHTIGGLQRDASGSIISAKAHLLHYVTTTIGNNWEDLFIENAKQGRSGLNVYLSAYSSRVLEEGNIFTRELPLLIIGFSLIFIYIILMSGKFSLLEHKTHVALMGVTAAGLSMASGIGLVASFGLKWTSLNVIVPFLAIAIGVDDMFVLLQAWSGVEDDKNLRDKSIPEKAGLTLRTAGASITVTSITDLVVFSIGATSSLGAFASFNIYVAICILLLFFIECTFFLAILCLDQRRKDERYDACLTCCYKHKDTYKAGKCSEREFFQMFFEDGLGRIVTKLPFAIIVILITLGLTGFMVWGFYNLKIEFDADWYLPSTSYLVTFNNKYDEYFDVGASAAAYVIETDFYTEREKLHTLYERIQANSKIDTTYLRSWFENYVLWCATAKGISDVYAENAFSSSTAFYTSVNEFLSSTGSHFVHDVVFKDNVIIGSRFHFRHILVPTDADNIEIVESLQADCNYAGFSTGYCFSRGPFYLFYEIVRIIGLEVYRNLGIALACVFIMVLPMLSSLQMGFWVTLCVVFTTVDVAGTMYLAGLAIEASTVITLLLSIGLAVDYAAHVGHKFLLLKGSRKMRIRTALGRIGLAVFNGGFSTFLALVALSASDTYTYRVFFTICACVVGFGLWNGLVFLPCVLAFVGPQPLITATEARLSTRHHAKKTKVQNTTTQSQHD